MRLGIDLDDTTLDFNAGFRKAYDESFGVLLQREDFTGWTLKDVTHFTSSTKLWKWLEKDHPEFFADLNPIPGAVNGIKELKDDGHKIVIITCKPDWALGSPKAALTRLDIPHDEIHIPGKDPKIHCPKYTVPCDVYFDDSPHQLELLRKETDSVVVRMVQAWNAPIDGVYDVWNWTQFVNLVKSLEVVKRLSVKMSYGG